MYVITETPIEAFEKISAHLLAQKQQSIDENGECMYRGLDGCKCAFGALIPDEVYDPSLEGKSISKLVDSSRITFLCEKTYTVCKRLQKFHDERWPYKIICRDTKKVERALKAIWLELELDV